MIATLVMVVIVVSKVYGCTWISAFCSLLLLSETEEVNNKKGAC